MQFMIYKRVGFYVVYPQGRVILNGTAQRYCSTACRAATVQPVQKGWPCGKEDRTLPHRTHTHTETNPNDTNSTFLIPPTHSYSVSPLC